ncbi:FadR/GntR family transcriptional regulator [Paenibacillus bovis]|uniref:GntR family transcriptional regulator n=1 Tax=Paenibacillus bovis TaxID=1616788 RepID=A0A172ZCI0_9BACL|nr:FadR/GntR family transcriptional regulator [Paenibacillus bovis]ANF95354.1 GntR family transcriptional regulator [Paenibacillus bovis]
MFDKLEKKSLVDQVYAQIEQRIKDGQWEIGTRIPREAELMEQFGVSRNTLREAVRALVHVGLLSTRQGDGTFVTASSELSSVLQKRVQRSTMVEIMEVRHALDREAARLACLRRTDEDLQTMDQYADLCHQHTEAGDVEAFVEADMKLHQAIVAASYNGLLIDLYANLFEQIQMSILSTTEMSNDRYHTGHRNLIVAIREQQPDQAASVVDDYISHFTGILFERNL